MKTVHMMGIGGAGMTSLAGMLKEMGWKVRGSDQKIYPPASQELARMKIPVCEGFNEKNLSPQPDLVIVGNVISRNNPEAQALLASKIPYTSMSQALRKYVLKDRIPVVVTGTHGKTTNTSLLSWILDRADLSPGLFVGGIPSNFGHGYRLGTGKHFVLEGDEYDTAFFEKTPKFLHYGTQHAIITSIEFDHADIYKDVGEIQTQFEKFIAQIPKEGVLVACGDHERVRAVCRKNRSENTKFYGLKEGNEWTAGNLQDTSRGKSFDILCQGKTFARVKSPLLGEHNVRNVLACAALATELGVAVGEIVEAVAKFRGVRKRQEFLGEARGIRLYDDFAHHPTAILETLKAFQPLVKASGARLWAVLEPRSNTLRRKVFQEDLPRSLQIADFIVLAPVYKKQDALPENEKLHIQDVARQLNNKDRKALAAKTLDEIVSFVTENAQPKDVVVFMSNGNFNNVPKQVLKSLQQ